MAVVEPVMSLSDKGLVPAILRITEQYMNIMHNRYAAKYKSGQHEGTDSFLDRYTVLRLV